MKLEMPSFRDSEKTFLSRRKLLGVILTSSEVRVDSAVESFLLRGGWMK